MLNAEKALELETSPSESVILSDGVAVAGPPSPVYKCSTETVKPASDQKIIRRSSRIRQQIEALVSPDKTINVSKGNTAPTNDTESLNLVEDFAMEAKVTMHTDSIVFKKPKISPMKVKAKETKNKSEEDNSNQINNTKMKEKSIDIDNTINDPKPSTSKLINSDEESFTSHDAIKPELSNQDDSHVDSQCPSSNDANMSDYIFNRKRINLYAPYTGPQMYHAKGNLVTRPIITKNLPKVFQYLPIHGKPGPKTTLEEFYRSKIREFVGCDLNDEEFEDLENYCSPELLKSGKEIKMQTNVPVMGLLNANILHNNFTKPDMSDDAPDLYILKKNTLRLGNKDFKTLFTKKLKYRGVRILPCNQEENRPTTSASTSAAESDEELEPGTDILYRVRIYRPYTYSIAKDRYTRCRHSVFSCDVLVTGRHKLTALRDRFVCHNDFDLRIDVSNHPDMLPSAVAKEVFPSGFLFINNVFYVDTRDGCIDYSAPIREWAAKRKLGNFPRRDMADVRFDELVLKLGYPEVYVHQGNCEHVFIFSEVRLLSANDPLRFSSYPCSTSIAQNQTVYCTTCAEFSAKWIVVGSDRVPFDPGFFCDICFKQYMYKDSQKIGEFKAFRYRGNALNVLKPI